MRKNGGPPHQAWPSLRLAFYLAAGWLGIAPLVCAANAAYDPSRLGELSIEELANIEITSVAKRPQKLRAAAASIYVITQQDIRRSGATTIPEALRLAPNLQVARQTASQYAISARGFNSTTANKLLVLIDGRSVYTPLFSGVFWDVQDTLLEDIDRIEVISGPGATLWGANAVNGIINIITRQAMESLGALASAYAGPKERGAGVRYGARLPGQAAWRMYGKATEHHATDAGGNRRQDAWRLAQGGFRYDRKNAEYDFTVQGDVYSGSSEQPVFERRTFEGGNLLGRWNRVLRDGSNLQVQTYYDYTKRVYPGTFGETLHTIDVDIQHSFRKGLHEILWGGGYRYADDQVQNTPLLAFLPAHRTLRVANVFVQDDIQLVPDKLNLTIGSKLERNSYSGFDFQPSARLSWKGGAHYQLWGAISRAARAPARIDTDFFATLSPTLFLAGGPDFASEKVTAYELGYRGSINVHTSLSATIFHNRYRALRNLEIASPGVVVLSNRMEGETSGLELWGEWRPRPQWRLHAGYLYLRKNLRLPADSTDPFGIPAAGNDPPYQIFLRASADLANRVEWDASVRRVGELPSPRIPAYTALDMRWAWKPSKQFELALIGQNLLGAGHVEFSSMPAPSEIGRSIFVKATWHF